MLKVDFISLSLNHHIDDPGFDASESEVYLRGKGTGISVPAVYLEAAIQLDDNRYLLFVTDDCPFDESLEIVLIEIGKGILEQSALYVINGTGTFKNLSVYHSHLEFSYFSHEVWKLTVGQRQHFKFPRRGRLSVMRHRIKIRYFVHIELINDN